MGGMLKDRWCVPSTAVAHEFIDEYMAGANGEYVKVYLFVLRHQGEEITIERIADALNHTESDVRRALVYWEKLGILAAARETSGAACAGRQEAGPMHLGESEPGDCEYVQSHYHRPAFGCQDNRGQDTIGLDNRTRNGNGQNSRIQGATGLDTRELDSRIQDARGLDIKGQDIRRMDAVSQDTIRQDTGGMDIRSQDTGNRADRDPAVANRHGKETDRPAKADRDEPVYSAEQVNRLSQDEEFSQLLYIAQKYLNKVFTPRDCQVFAYMYEDLGMNEELLEYLVEYCVQNDHTSIRYIEAVARSWHEKGIRTAQEAKDFSASYSRDSFAVMKAFGINSRKPAAPEQKLMDKWFKDYGFSRDVVLEACNRTITAIHNPSFQYADKILTDWKSAGVRGVADIKELDARRNAAREENSQARDKRLQKYDSAVAGQGNRTRKGAPNQFHNFEQRDTDYDALMLKQVKEWVGQQP